MINYWEADSETDSGCLKYPNDADFFIPIARTDFIPLRLNIPYVQIEDNGGGLPTSATVSIVSADGTLTSVSYGATAANKFLQSLINDSTNRIAEYKFMLPNPFEDEIGDSYNLYTFAVASGDKINLTVNGVTYYFRYGYDETPFPLIAYKSGYLLIGLSDTDYGFTTLLVNGSPVTPGTMTSAMAAAAYENEYCFRVKVSISFSTAGVTRNYYTKLFKFVKCEETVFVEGQYPSGTIDCLGQEHAQNDSSVFYQNKLYMRLFADIEQMRARTKVSMNSKCYVYKSERTQLAKLKSEPMPGWYAESFEAVALSQTLRIENVQYYPDEVDNILQDSDLPGTSFMNIDLPLQQCKCERVFVCQ